MNMTDRIQTLRKYMGISQEELADKIGVSRQAVSKWESEQSICKNFFCGRINYYGDRMHDFCYWTIHRRL